MLRNAPGHGSSACKLQIETPESLVNGQGEKFP